MKKIMMFFVSALALLLAQADNDIFTHRGSTITGFKDGAVVPETLVIPSYIGSTKITAIGSEAFANADDKDNVKVVVISDTITTFGEWAAFDYFTNLEEVYIGSGLKNYGDYSQFSSCENLSTIIVAEDNKYFKVVDGALLSKDGKTLYLVPGNVSSFTIPATVTRLFDGAFASNYKIAELTIPTHVTKIDSFVFENGAPIKFLVPESHKYFSADEQGALYDKKKTKLLVARANREGTFDIPSSVTEIFESAFNGDNNLKFITIPNFVNTIGFCAFSCCESLQSVVIGSSVMTIDEGAFEWCKCLLEIYFMGPPPTSVDDEAFKELPANSVGYYSSRYQDEWDRVLDSRDKWHGIRMMVSYDLDDDDNAGDPTPDNPSSDLPSAFRFLPGQKVSVEIGLVGYSAKGLPSGLKFNSKTGTISGAAKKPTGETGVTVTFSKKGAASQTTVVIVDPIPTVNVTLAGDSDKCKVKGAGKAYLVDKKVSLSVTTPKGTAFIGWAKDGEPWPNETESRNTKLSFTMPEENLNLVATFEKEQMLLVCPGLEEGVFQVGVAGGGSGIPLEISTQSGIKSVKAAKLPKGMKLVKDKETGEWMITGSATKAGTYNVALTVTANSGATETVTFPVTVKPLPDWAVGTFGGFIGRFYSADDDDFTLYGMISMKIITSGKMTAKITARGKTCTLSGVGFDSAENDVYSFTLKSKAGDVYHGVLDGAFHDVARLVADEDYDTRGVFTMATGSSYDAFIWRNEHGKDGRLDADPTGRAQRVMDAIKDMKTLELASFNPSFGTLKLSIDKKGNVKLSGKTADGVSLKGTSFLILDHYSYHVIADMACYDKKSGNIYEFIICWQPIFDASGNIVDWDWDCCDHSRLFIHSFE